MLYTGEKSRGGGGGGRLESPTRVFDGRRLPQVWFPGPSGPPAVSGNKPISQHRARSSPELPPGVVKTQHKVTTWRWSGFLSPTQKIKRIRESSVGGKKKKREREIGGERRREKREQRAERKEEVVEEKRKG